LPALLLAAAAFIALRNQRFGRKTSPGIDVDQGGRSLVKILAVLHLGITFQAVVRLTQELLTMQEMGVTESFGTFIGQTISVVVNPFLALGFWRRWRAARWIAISWYLLLSTLGAIVTVFILRFPARLDPLWWADYFAGRLMPFFLLFAMFLPRVKRVFSRGHVEADSQIAGSPDELEPPRRPRWSIITTLMLLCLIVVFSNLAVDIADWVERSITATDDLPTDRGEIE
jgi:hypothetical protein